MTEEERTDRRMKKGKVISNKMAKTVVVEIEYMMRHPRYQKMIKRRQKLYAHHELEAIPEGTVVTVMETRPLSKLKRWRVVSVEA